MLLVLCLVALTLAGCSSKPLVYDLLIRPDVISPNADGIADVARITYRLSRHARISMYFVDEQGNRHAFRSEASRPRGSYETLFSGVINNRLLPDGRYN